MLQIRKRHRELARKLYEYIRTNSEADFIDWEKLNKKQQDWWYRAAVTATQHEKEAA